jgi:hypothetical protein
MHIFDLIPHIHKARAPDNILDVVDHYEGTADGTRINTSSFGLLKEWYEANKHRPNLRVYAVVEDLQHLATT